MRLKLPFVILMAILVLIIWFILRVVLWVDVGPSQLSLGQTIKVFTHGFWFDLNTLFYLCVPWILISLFSPDWIRKWRFIKTLKWIALFSVIFSILFGVVSELIFWQEFTTRFNFIAVDYLIYTHEVIGNIKESYPIPLIMLVISCVALLITWITSCYVAFKTYPKTSKQKTINLIALLCLPLFSYQFADADQMSFSKNAYANELSGNGLFTLAAAMRRNELDYEQFYRTISYDKANNILRLLNVRRQLGSVALNQAPKPQNIDKYSPFKRRPKNIILVSIESLSASYVGAYGNTENLTPEMDKLASEGLMFDKIFATGTRTVRGLDALSIAIPPIPGQAIVRRPDNEHITTIGALLEAQGFSTFFIYGGYGYFDNMNSYFASNHYQVIDRTDFDKATIQHENIWGVDDESLFNNALIKLDAANKTGKPFFAHIMTTSNHRPFTFPENKIDLPQGKRNSAVKYTDYAIGQLIKNAKNKPWFKDTLFVIVADHCASVAGKTKLPVAKYHIPLFFYAPDILPSGHYPRMASQIDIVPTLLDVLGAKGENHFFGQSLFSETSSQIESRAFISNYQELGYYKRNTLIVLSPKQIAESYHIDPITMDSTPIEMDEALLNEAIAYYQMSNYAFKNGNLKEKH